MPKNDHANDKKLKTRYEVKGERQAGATRAKLVSQVNAFLQALVAKPSMWMDPLLEEVRKCVGRILSDPCAFPPALPQTSNTKQAQARRPSMDSSSSLPLTPGVAQALYDRQELGNGMVVQITNGSKKSVKNTIAGQVCHFWHHSYHAVDGDEHILTLKLDTALSGSAIFLTNGSIVALNLVHALYYDYGNKDDLRSLLLVKNFTIRGHMRLQSKFLVAPTERLKVRQTRIHKESTAAVKDNTGTPPEIDCKGNLCSVHGVKSIICVCNAVPTRSVVLPQVASECVFVDKEFSSMTNRHKRFLLYYWYATNVFQFRGKGNRINLPKCFVRDIWTLYPELDGKYSTEGYEES